jgi:NAD+ kinase
MKRIGIIANCEKPDAPDVLRRVEARAAELGITLVTCDGTAELLSEAEAVEPGALAESIDVLMAFGGDGTMLRAVRALGGVDVPLLGVNLGSLGFMTSVPEEDADRALEVLSEDAYTTSARSTAICRVFRNGSMEDEYRSLNDVVVGWGESARVVTLAVLVDGDKVTSYMCDGLIISTPTGSTGHQLSAGGPILHPESPAFVINVVCPHTLTTRPIVVPDRSVITVHIAESPKQLIMAVDGQETRRVEQDDRIEVTRHPVNVRFLHLPGYNYFSVLRHKLGWRGSVRG